MKNIEYVGVEELPEYMEHLWVTPEFKEAYLDTTSFLRSIVDKFMTVPRGFFTPTDLIEKGHFTSWMNFIDKRSYDNPYVQDLYFFHEIAHQAFMTYEELPFYSWFEKMQENEILASMCSEVFIYYFMKKEGRCIRNKTFEFSIWYDEIQKELEIVQDVHNKNFLEKFSEFFAQRRALSHALFEGSPTRTEWQISRYSQQNFSWALMWKDNYAYVEESMRLFMEYFEQTQDSIAAMEFLMKRYVPYLREDVFFYEEAVAFRKLYVCNNEKFGEYTKAQAVDSSLEYSRSKVEGL